jgi:hypothetical protein
MMRTVFYADFPMPKTSSNRVFVVATQDASAHPLAFSVTASGLTSFRHAPEPALPWPAVKTSTPGRKIRAKPSASNNTRHKRHRRAVIGHIRSRFVRVGERRRDWLSRQIGD